ARSDELLTDIRFKKPSPGGRSAFIKLGRRNAVSISRLSVAAMLRLNNEKIVQEARIVPGATFPTWQRIAEAERVLVGKRFSFELATQAGTVVASESKRRSTAASIRWRSHRIKPCSSSFGKNSG
ncbi:MAG: hypothetical protein MUF82_02155, partial [Bacteroidetes bacterium]|nr:hypothetical protein [Bacteroidota bacterium]